jgi:predicted lipoprotein with Yx(FWY)xxD motif
MANMKAIAAAFVVLTVIFAAATGYLVAYPVKTTVVSTTTQMVGAAYTVNVAYKSGIGFYLTNGSGFTLYFRSTDTPNSGNTTCTSSTCETNWPVFYSATLSLPPGLNASSFSTITPYNGTKILTYDGYPLYYWTHDAKPGDTTGQGTGGFYAATLPTPTKPGA